MGFYYFDYTYLLFLAPAIIITMIAQIGVKTTFNKYSKVLNMKGLTGAAAAQRVLEHGGSLLTQVQMTGGHKAYMAAQPYLLLGWQPMKQVTRFSMQQVMDLSNSGLPFIRL